MKIHIPTPFHPFAGRQAAANAPATTVGGASDVSVQQFPGPSNGPDGLVSALQPSPAQDRDQDKDTHVVNGIPQMHPTDLKRRLDAGEDVLVLDVREPHEYAIAHIGGHLIPLGALPHRMEELDPNQKIVVHCKAGIRSQRAAEFLARAGFKKLHNLVGGILGWADAVDPSVRKY
jgi:rhodanese-related sulfurtransferase